MQPKQFDEWNKAKKKTDSRTRAPVKEGEVYWCRLGINIGVEQDGDMQEFQRPVLILKKFSHEIVLAVPLTKREKTGDWYHSLPHFGSTSTLVLNQARPIDTKRLLESMGQISESELARARAAYCALINP